MEVSEHDRALMATLDAERRSALVAADDPDRVAGVLVDRGARRAVDVSEALAVLSDRGRLLALAVSVRDARALVAAVETTERQDVGDGLERRPAVRAARSHLRRREADWKVAWWEREEPVPDAASWEAEPVDLVAVARPGVIDREAFATMAAGAPTAIRVVIVLPRPA